MIHNQTPPHRNPTPQAASTTEPDVVLRVVHSDHEVEDPEIVKTSRRFDSLPAGTEVALFAAPVAAQPDDLTPLARAVGYDTPSDGELRSVIKRMGYGHLVESGQPQIEGNEIIDIVRAFATPGKLSAAVAEAGGSA